MLISRVEYMTSTTCSAVIVMADVIAFYIVHKIILSFTDETLLDIM